MTTGGLARDEQVTARQATAGETTAGQATARQAAAREAARGKGAPGEWTAREEQAALGERSGESGVAGPGKTYLTGLIGAGIGPSLSPPLHEHEAAALGLRYVYRLIAIDRAALDAADTPALIRSARLFGFDGLNITHPCKQAAAEDLDELSPEAAALGAVNTVVFRDGRAIGHNTDWSGFARSLLRGLPGAALGHVVVLGAGGAGAAACYALARLGTRRVTVIDADASRAAALATALAGALNASPAGGRPTTVAGGRPTTVAGGRPGPGGCRISDVPLAGLAGALAGADGLVHATPTGMAAHPGIAVPADALRPGLWVADVVYRPLHTELLRAARAAGCRTLDGGAMAVFQAADAFTLFTGAEPDTDRMMAHFTRLTAEEAGHARSG